MYDYFNTEVGLSGSGITVPESFRLHCGSRWRFSTLMKVVAGSPENGKSFHELVCCLSGEIGGIMPETLVVPDIPVVLYENLSTKPSIRTIQLPDCSFKSLV
jgi:hypothetical protein